MKHKVFLFAIVLMVITIPNEVLSQTFSSVSPSGHTLYYCAPGNGHCRLYNAPDSNLTGDLIIPDSVQYGGSWYHVTVIDEFTFQDRTSLKSITVPDCVTQIGYGAFQNVKHIIYHGPVTENRGEIVRNGFIDGDFVYTDSSRTQLGVYIGTSSNISIPNSVVSIGNRAFMQCTFLTSINIGSNVTSIGSFSFDDCTNLSSVTFGENLETIGSYAFRKCTSLSSISIPNSVITIGSCAFCICTGLTSAILGNNVTTLESNVFSGCTNLSSVTMGDSVTSIGNYAFYGCTKLINIYIPSSVTTIGSVAFRRVKNVVYHGTATGSPWGALTVNGVVDSEFVFVDSARTQLTAYIGTNPTASVPNGVISIGEESFKECTELTSVTFPNSVTTVGDEAFYACSSLRQASLGDGITTIGEKSFQNCDSLVSVTFGSNSNLISIGKSAFYGCSSLIQALLGDSITTIGDYAFYNCSSLTHVSLGNSLTSIDKWVFRNCTSLTTIIIPNSVTVISSCAFSGCSNLSFVTVGSSVTSIGAWSFDYCNKLDSIIMLPEIPPTLNGQLFEDDLLDSITFYVPCGLASQYQNAWTRTPPYKIQEADAPLTMSVNVNDSTSGSAYIIPQDGQNVACADSSVVIYATANDGWHFHHWSNGNIANPDTLFLAGDSTITAMFTPDITMELCMVSVQDNHNMVLWTKEQEVLQYNIYREGTTTGDYELVASIPYDSASVWVDIGSHPKSRSYRYRMTATETFGMESEPSTVHKPMHLTISPGMGDNCWNLNWTEYEGTDFVSYMIYRGSHSNGLELIDQMPVGGNTTYTDESAPSSTVHYQVVAVKSTPCNITKSESLIRSNIATNNEDVGISNIIDIKGINVFLKDKRIIIEGLIGQSVGVYTIDGRTIASLPRASEHVEIPVTTLGVYIIKIGDHPARKVVVLQ